MRCAPPMRCPESFRRCGSAPLAGRRRAGQSDSGVGGARLVIAVNLNSDILGRGATVSDHGSDESDERYRQEMLKHSGLRSAIFGTERELKRQFFGGTGRPGIPT